MNVISKNAALELYQKIRDINKNAPHCMKELLTIERKLRDFLYFPS